MPAGRKDQLFPTLLVSSCMFLSRLVFMFFYQGLPEQCIEQFTLFWDSSTINSQVFCCCFEHPQVVKEGLLRCRNTLLNIGLKNLYTLHANCKSPGIAFFQFILCMVHWYESLLRTSSSIQNHWYIHVQGGGSGTVLLHTNPGQNLVCKKKLPEPSSYMYVLIIQTASTKCVTLRSSEAAIFISWCACTIQILGSLYVNTR